jgi:hypothetical protein
MKVQLMEFEYSTGNAPEIEERLNEFMSHYDVVNTEVVRADERILAFLFYEE